MPKKRKNKKQVEHLDVQQLDLIPGVDYEEINKKRERHRLRQAKSAENRASNRHILRVSAVSITCIALACCTLLYTMVTQKHLWSGNLAINSMIRNSVQARTINGVRGDILDRSNQVLARQTIAYTLAANFDTRTEEEKAAEERLIEAQRQNALYKAELNGRTEQTEAALAAADAASTGSYVEDPQAFAAAIKSVLGDAVNEETLVRLLERGQIQGKSQIELGTGTKRISRENKEKLESMKIPGLSFIETTKRDYPITPLSSNLIGFAAYDDTAQNIVGKLGLEKSMDLYLGSEDGQEQYRATNTNQELPGSRETITEAVNGDHVKLTLDSSLQQTVEEQMRFTMEDSQASAAWTLVMEVETGKILAWASYPTYDQNSHLDIPSYIDKVSEYPLEPGSIIKPLYYAMAIDAGVYPYNQTYRAGEFAYTEDPLTGQITRVGSQYETSIPPILDALGKDHGVLTFEDGLALSSNIALCELLANHLNKETVNQYLDEFDLFKKTGIPFVNEQVGIQNTTSATDYLSSGFGQASSMTILELCKAYTAIFNDGIMMQPYIVDSIIDSSTGTTLQKNSPQAVGTPISANTAHQVVDLMRHVLDPGMTGDRFAIEGVDMALKTGTGEIYNEDTYTYDKENYTSSIIAAAPASDPKVLVCYGMQGPNYLNYSADPFKEIMKSALQTVNVNTGTDRSVTEQHQEWVSSPMPSLTSHSLNYAQEKLAGCEVNTIIIGDGDTVVAQFPNPSTTINSNDNVMLLTNGSARQMPDMIGWTRKDITAFWNLTGISISADGYGRVHWQSIPATTPIQDDTVIEVKLE